MYIDLANAGFFMPEINIRLAVTFGQSYMCSYAQ
nr:MAG TPA: hypothetical protein [Caudoviricetes sp.]